MVHVCIDSEITPLGPISGIKSPELGPTRLGSGHEAKLTLWG